MTAAARGRWALIWPGVLLLASCAPSNDKTGDAGAGATKDVEGRENPADSGSQRDQVDVLDTLATDAGSAADAHQKADVGPLDTVAMADAGQLDLDGATWGDAQPLALPDAWTLVAAADDPFDTYDYKGAVPCTQAAIKNPEVDGEVWLEVETLDCNAAALKTATKLSLSPGDRVDVRVWRFQLVVGDAGYELSLHAGGPKGEVLWARSLEFPGKSGLWADSHILKGSFAAGAPLWWRVRNHGVNSWNLVEVSRRALVKP